MNNPSPLLPQGSLLEQKTRSQSRVKIAILAVIAIHVIGLTALLFQGCKREQPLSGTEGDTNYTDMDYMADTNYIPSYATPTPVPPVPEPGTTIPPTVPAPTITTLPPVQQPSATEYTIVRGDTFTSIARNHGVTDRAIQQANPGVEPTRLMPGQKIVIPPPSATPAANGGATAPTVSETGEQIYVVKSGDTLTRIANRYNTTVRALRDANNLTTDRIKVGDKLRIPAPPAQ
jgi:LysM repeat protein